MIQTTCCVTGHRDIPSGQVTYVKKRLQEELEAAIVDGYSTFLSGFAAGVDLFFAELVIAQKARHPHLRLQAAIPYRNRLDTSDPLFHRCLAACDSVYVQQEVYSPNCFLDRNRYLVAQSGRVIAVFDGRARGGTQFTMRRARDQGRELREITLRTASSAIKPDCVRW